MISSPPFMGPEGLFDRVFSSYANPGLFVTLSEWGEGGIHYKKSHRKTKFRNHLKHKKFD
jgi:hypothetical protein